MTIYINEVTKRYTDDLILDKVTLKINEQKHIGIIGENGCGKSTLLKILAGMEPIQEGSIIYPKHTKIAYLQQVFDDFQGTLMQFLLQGFHEIIQLQDKMRVLEEAMANPEKLNQMETLLEKYCRVCEQFEKAEGYDLIYRIELITQGLGIAPLMEQEYDVLSGGEKMRANLAGLLLKKPDVLLMDEPTNHLDYSGVIWLENYLKTLNATAIIVSHDRTFLNHTVNKIVEIECGELIAYTGNYDVYKQEKALRLERLMQDYEQQQKEIMKLKNAIRRFRQWGLEGDNEKFYKKAKQLERKLEQMELLRKPKATHKEMRISFSDFERSSQEVFMCKHMYLSFGEKIILEDASFSLYWQDRIAICGDNGCGKSTFLKILMEKESLDAGERKVGSRLNIGYLPQTIVFPDESERILQYFCFEAALHEEKARAYLTRFGFMQVDMHKRLRQLSGGERTRLQLALIMLEKVNMVIFDEPTNHLDFASIEIIESILKSFQGILLIVSHDRYLIKQVTTKQYTIKGGKMVEMNI